MPACSRPAPESDLSQFSSDPTVFKPLPRSLVGLAGIMALLEVIFSLADRGWLFNPALRPVAFEYGAFWSPLLRGAQPLFSGQPWTMFLTHALLHGSLFHMVMNVTILLALGRLASDHYGNRVILPLFFAGAVGGGLAFGLISATPYPMIGASGAVFAFLGVWIVWDWRRHRDARVSTAPVMTRILVFAGMNLVLWFALGGMVAWEAHLGGFLVGLVAGWFLETRNAARARARHATLRRLRTPRD